MLNNMFLTTAHSKWSAIKNMVTTIYVTGKGFDPEVGPTDALKELCKCQGGECLYSGQNLFN